MSGAPTSRSKPVHGRHLKKGEELVVLWKKAKAQQGSDTSHSRDFIDCLIKASLQGQGLPVTLPKRAVQCDVIIAGEVVKVTIDLAAYMPDGGRIHSIGVTHPEMDTMGDAEMDKLVGPRVIAAWKLSRVPYKTGTAVVISGRTRHQACTIPMDRNMVKEVALIGLDAFSCSAWEQWKNLMHDPYNEL